MGPMLALLLATGFQISTRPEEVTILHSPQQLQRTCGAAVPACTRVLGISLRLKCEHSDEWQVRGEASIAPYMYTAQEWLLVHEREHVTDIVRRIESYGDHLLTLRFRTSNDCWSIARAEEAVFPARVQYFGKLSQELLQ